MRVVLTGEPEVAGAGAEVEVLGQGLYDGICYDVGGCRQRQPDKARPAEGLTLVLFLTSTNLVLEPPG